MDLLVAIAVNGAFWVLISEGIYAFWISQAKSADEKARRSNSKAVNWDSRWRWVLIAFVVIASVSQYV